MSGATRVVLTEAEATEVWRARKQGGDGVLYGAVERIVAGRLADAWDEGMRCGTSRAMRMMSDEPNPYRATERAQ